MPASRACSARSFSSAARQGANRRVNPSRVWDPKAGPSDADGTRMERPGFELRGGTVGHVRAGSGSGRPIVGPSHAVPSTPTKTAVEDERQSIGARRTRGVERRLAIVPLAKIVARALVHRRAVQPQVVAHAVHIHVGREEPHAARRRPRASRPARQMQDGRPSSGGAHVARQQPASSGAARPSRHVPQNDVGGPARRGRHEQFLFERRSRSQPKMEVDSPEDLIDIS